MKSKILKKYIYHGLGVPITLHNVQTLEVHEGSGEYFPLIDVRAVSEKLAKRLYKKKSPLTEAEKDFLRVYEFGKSNS